MVSVYRHLMIYSGPQGLTLTVIQILNLNKALIFPLAWSAIFRMAARLVWNGAKDILII